MRVWTRARAAVAVSGVLAAMLMASLATTASAGVDTGRVEARMDPTSQAQGGTVTLTVTATQDPSAEGSSRYDMNLGFDGRALTFVRHEDPGACRAYPASSQPPETIDTALYCDQAPGRPSKTDRFTFAVKPDAPVGATTLYAGANYGSARASAPRVSLTVTAAPIQGGGNGPIQGGDGGIVQGPGAGGGVLGETTNNVRGETDRLLFRTTMSAFTGSAYRYPSQLDWSTDGCSVPLISEPQRSQPHGADFRNACWRHDFGYRNYKKQGRFTEDNRALIDANFLKDMSAVCNAFTGDQALRKSNCLNDAVTYHRVVRVCGGSPQPYCAGPIIENGRRINELLSRPR